MKGHRIKPKNKITAVDLRAIAALYQIVSDYLKMNRLLSKPKRKPIK